jgi:hypothetical protein
VRGDEPAGAMRFALVKTAEQQAALMLVGVQDRLIRNRTRLANSIRSYAAEFGLTAAKGMAHLAPLLERIQADETLPALARELFASQAEEYAQLQAQIDDVEAKFTAWHRADECSRRLAKIPSGSFGPSKQATNWSDAASSDGTPEVESIGSESGKPCRMSRTFQMRFPCRPASGFW